MNVLNDSWQAPSDERVTKIVPDWQPTASCQGRPSERYVTSGGLNRLPPTHAPARHQVGGPKLASGPKRGLSREEAANYVGVSPSKFDQLRKQGRMGRPRLIDGRKVWDIQQLDRDFEAFPVEGDQEDEDWSTSL